MKDTNNINLMIVDSDDLSLMNKAVIEVISEELSDTSYKEKNGKYKIFPRIIQLALDFEQNVQDIPGFYDNDDSYSFAYYNCNEILNDIAEISEIMGIDPWEYISKNIFWTWENKPTSYEFYINAINCSYCVTEERKTVAEFLTWYAVSETFKKIKYLYTGKDDE